MDRVPSGSTAAFPAGGGGPLPRLTAMRCFGALAVLIFHLNRWDILSANPRLSQVGYAGVAFFFVLSGLVLGWGTREGVATLTFYRRRIARVWPSHLVMLLVAAVLPVNAVGKSLPLAVPNVLLVQAWFTDYRVVYGFNGVSWSLSCELFFYLCFPLAVVILRRLPRRARWGVCAGSLVLELLAYIAAPELVYHLPGARFAEFLLGLVAGLELRSGWRPRIPAVAVVVLVVLGIAVSTMVPLPYANSILAVPFLSALLCAALADLRGAPGWLTRPWLVFAGELSFAFYLVHELVIVNFRPHLTTHPVVNVAVVVTLSLGSALALHLLIERPANRLLRGRPRPSSRPDPMPL